MVDTHFSATALTPAPRRLWSFKPIVLTFLALSGLAMVALSGVTLYEQSRITHDAADIANQQLPRIIKIQRIARDLEALRHYGELLLAQPEAQARKDAQATAQQLVQALLPQVDSKTRNTVSLAGELISRLPNSAAADINLHLRWQMVASELANAANETSDQANRATQDHAKKIHSAAERTFVWVAVALTGFFVLVGGTILLLRVLVLSPLRRITKALDTVEASADLDASDFPPIEEVDRLCLAANQLAATLQANQAAHAAMVRLAHTDELSGLANRRAFQERGHRLFERWHESGRSLALVLCDLDFFKRVNDRFGHDAGDKVIVAFSKVLKQAFHGNDFPARIGGEEFAVLIPDLDLELVRQTVEQVRHNVTLQTVLLADGREIRFTASFGIALLKLGDTHFDDALRRADAALYLAKESGRNRVAIAPASLNQETPHESD
jgi:diguanylate cyclase (GGDEF)-like protein